MNNKALRELFVVAVGQVVVSVMIVAVAATMLSLCWPVAIALLPSLPPLGWWQCAELYLLLRVVGYALFGFVGKSHD